MDAHGRAGHGDAGHPVGHQPHGGDEEPAGHERHEGHQQPADHERHEGREQPAGHERHEGHSVAMFRDRFWLTLALTVPTVVWSPMIQMWFGYSAPTFPG